MREVVHWAATFLADRVSVCGFGRTDRCRGKPEHHRNLCRSGGGLFPGGGNAGFAGIAGNFRHHIGNGRRRGIKTGKSRASSGDRPGGMARCRAGRVVRESHPVGAGALCSRRKIRARHSTGCERREFPSTRTPRIFGWIPRISAMTRWPPPCWPESPAAKGSDECANRDRV